MKPNKASSLALVQLCCRALDAKKAEDLRVLEVGEVSSITDYLVVATATSDTHLRALRVDLEKVLDASKARIVGIETAQESGWTVVDAFDVMIHLFRAERREQFGLESLWKDAVEIPLAEVLAEKPAKPAPKKAAKAKPAAKKAVKKKTKKGS